MATLIRIEIERGRNENGESAFLVTPYFLTKDGRTLSVPDSKGWATESEAREEAEYIANR
jgi:hypothetical protein